MIKITSGNVWDDDSESILVPVNNSGICSSGIALDFKEKLPDAYNAFKETCDRKMIHMGSVFVFPLKDNTNKSNLKYIVNIPIRTKWFKYANLEFIEAGLDSLLEWMSDYDVRSVAIPAIGCGSGGLLWDTVRDKMILRFNKYQEKRFMLYAPIVKK